MNSSDRERWVQHTLAGHIKNVSRLSSALVAPILSLSGGMEALTLSHMDGVSFANRSWRQEIVSFC